MARTFRRRREAHPIAELNVTNLVDLAFVLLIVFMIATPLIQQEQTTAVNLPVTAKAPQTKADKDDTFSIVGVDAKGQFYVDNDAMAVTVEQLRIKLKAFAGLPKPPVIRVRGDSKVYYEKVAQLFVEVQRAGLSRVTIDTQSKQ